MKLIDLRNWFKKQSIILYHGAYSPTADNPTAPEPLYCYTQEPTEYDYADNLNYNPHRLIRLEIYYKAYNPSIFLNIENMLTGNGIAFKNPISDLYIEEENVYQAIYEFEVEI